MIKTLIACDPGDEGAFAIFKQDDDGWYLERFLRVQDYKQITTGEFYPALGVTEHNHGIQGQAAGTSYTQGYNAGMSQRTLDIVCTKVEKVIPQRWMKTFGVPKGMERTDRKKWIRDKAQQVTETKLPLWASDAVGIGLAYIKEMKANVG